MAEQELGALVDALGGEDVVGHVERQREAERVHGEPRARPGPERRAALRGWSGQLGPGGSLRHAYSPRARAAERSAAPAAPSTASRSSGASRAAPGTQATWSGFAGAAGAAAARTPCESEPAWASPKRSSRTSGLPSRALTPSMSSVRAASS